MRRSSLMREAAKTRIRKAIGVSFRRSESILIVESKKARFLPVCNFFKKGVLLYKPRSCPAAGRKPKGWFTSPDGNRLMALGLYPLSKW